MSSKTERTIGGFVFGTDEEAALAKKDEEKITFIENRIDWLKPGMTQVIYNKAIQNMIFETPVGYTYLSKMKQRLEKEGIEEVFDIPLDHASFQKRHNKKKKKIEPSKVTELKLKLRIAMLVNYVLGAIILIMFVITLTGNNPNIINYEKALIDKYASWDEELSERESTIREKERIIRKEEP